MNGNFGALATLIALSFAAPLAPGAPLTSITLDGSMGHGTGPIIGSSGVYNILPSMGTVAGSNIFQSFGTFNLGTGDTADFVANANTQNIIARVTGGSASSIDGTITSTVGVGGALSNANLFLINPAGIMFTANASLNLNGAFVASTANYVKLSDGTFFYADTQHPINDAGLTSAPVSAFGFLPAANQVPAPISFVGTQFTNAAGIHVIGGNLTLDQGATLLAPSGQLTLFSSASAGEVPFSLSAPGAGFASATTPTFGTITMQNQAHVGLDNSNGGGSIVIRGGQIVVNNASVTAANSGAFQGGSISVQATNLTVENAGTIATSVVAGDTQSGSAGPITVTASNAISLTGASTISGDTNGSGSGGVISLTAATLDIDGTGSAPQSTGVFDETSFANGGGNAGAVIVNAANTQILGGGAIDASSISGGGNAGNVTFHGTNLTIDGTGADALSTGIFSETLGGFGASGSVNVFVNGSTNILHGGVITANTQGGGDSGNVTFTGVSLTIDGSTGIAGFTGVFSDTLASGNSGSVTVDVSGPVSIVHGGVISTNSTQGNAGDVAFSGSSLTIDGSGATAGTTGVFSETGVTNSAQAQVAGTGNSGNVTVGVSGDTEILHGGEIAASIYGTGAAGNVVVNGENLVIDGSSAAPQFTGIFSESLLTGNSGNVAVNVSNSTDLAHGGVIEASTVQGAAGNVTFTGKSLTIDGSLAPAQETGVFSESQQFGASGDVQVKVTGKTNIENAGVIEVSSFGGGTAGEVQVSGASLGIIGYSSGIFSESLNSGSGTAGVVNVTISGGLGISDGGEINATTETASNGGEVNLKVGSLTLTGAKTEITTQASSQGNAGNVQIQSAGGVTLTGGAAVSTSSTASNAGDVSIAAMNFNLESGSEINTSADQNGGSITLKIQDVAYLYHGVIEASANPVTGVGGNITIDPEFTVLDDSLISASGGAANGNINIVTEYLVDSSSSITATGAITLSAPVLDLGGSLLPLPTELDTDADKLKESCVRSTSHEFSSLVVVGRGGTEIQPDELQPDFGSQDVSASARR